MIKRAALGVLVVALSCGCGRTDKTREDKAAPTETTEAEVHAPKSEKPAPTVDASSKASSSIEDFVKPGEVSAIEAKVLAMVEASKKRTCARPVLRGTAKPGSGTKALLEALLPAGDPGKTCKATLERLKDSLDEAVFLDKDEDKDKDQWGFPKRSRRSLAPLGAKVAKPIAKAVAACGRSLDAVRAAIQHSGVCSPWRPGVRPVPLIIQTVRLGKVASLRMKSLWSAGRANDAVTLGLDYVRAMQDLGRGGPAEVPPLIAGNGAAPALMTLEMMLNAPRMLGEAPLATLQRSVGVLLKTTVGYHDILEGNRLWKLLYLGMPMVKGKSWVPPAGWAETDRPPGPDEGAPLLTGDPKFDAEVAFVTMFHGTEDVAPSCPKAATTKACIDGMKARSVELNERVEKLGGYEGTMELMKSGDPIDAVRDRVFAIIKSASIMPFTKYGRRLGQTRFMLAALRLHGALRRVWETKKQCPSMALVDALDASLKVDPNSGAPMLIKALDGGQLVVLPSMRLTYPGRPAMHYRITCPRKAKRNKRRSR